MKLPTLSSLLVLSLTLALCGAHAAAPGSVKSDPGARLLRDASLMLLKEGNSRFVSGKPQHPHQDAERRTEVAKGQEPFATVLACSDSRDPVELIFDRGVGDVFVVRVAGNIAGLSELATVEYGIGHLNTPVLIVMGHSKCGAVTAVANGAELHGHLHALANKIQPAVDKTKAGNPEPDELVSRCIQANVWQTIEDIIKQSSVVRGKMAEGKVSILGAIYDLDQGKVTWLGQHPAEDSLVALAGQAATDESLVEKHNAHGKGHGGQKTSAHDASDVHGHAAPVAKFVPQVKPGAHDHPADTDTHGVPTATQANTAQVKPRTPPSKTPPPAEPFHDLRGHAPTKQPAKLAGPGDHH